MKTKILLTIGFLFLTVTSQAGPNEALYGSFFNESGVVIQVYSGGCTYKSSFAVRKEYVGGVHKIWFYRVKPDFCEAFVKYGKFLIFSYDDLGLQAYDRFEIMNPRVVPRVR
ncbi:MAG: hypothetical protein V4654_00685 [Bdellovibrionota bacterium]